MTTNTDIDIDFADRDKALRGLHHIPAMLITKTGVVQRHPSGVYFQDIPANPITNLCAFDYKTTGDLGYFSIDFLNQTVYQGVRDEEHLDTLLNTDPPWDLLQERTLVEQLPHIKNHFEIVELIQPKSIEDLAIVLAIMRPGKRHLLNRPRAHIEREIWRPVQADDGEEGAYTFKKAHAIAYAALVVVQFNIVVEQLLNDDDGISI